MHAFSWLVPAAHTPLGFQTSEMQPTTVHLLLQT